MAFSGGPKAASELLSHLTPSEQKRILSEIKKKDANLAETLEKSMTSVEDLRFITPKMLAEFLSQIKISDLALSLRICSEDLKAHLQKNVSNSICRELDDIIKGPPISVKKVQEAQSRILDKMREKLAKGELVISRKRDEVV